MSDKSDTSGSQPQDGFDLIEYPCDFAFKAMCRTGGDIASIDYIRGLITQLVDDGALLKLKSSASRTGKFESITATVKLKNRTELESIYKLIAQSPRVVMTL